MVFAFQEYRFVMEYAEKKSYDLSCFRCKIFQIDGYKLTTMITIESDNFQIKKGFGQA